MGLWDLGLFFSIHFRQHPKHQQLKTGMKFSVQVTEKVLDTVNGKVIEASADGLASLMSMKR